MKPLGLRSLGTVRSGILRWGLDTHRPAHRDGPAGFDLESVQQVPIDVADELFGWIEEERVDGLAWSAIIDSGDRSADPRIWQRLHDLHLDGMRATVAAEATAAFASGLLAQNGVDASLLKGLGSARLDYPVASWRSSHDADLLVARTDLTRAVQTLVDAGCRRVGPPVRSGWEQRFARAVELRSPDGVEIDVHASIVEGYFGLRLDHDALRRAPVDIEIGGVACRALNGPARLLAASYAACLSRGPVQRLIRDIGQMLTNGVDVDAASALAGEGGVLVDRAVETATETLGLSRSAHTTSATRTPDVERALTYAVAADRNGWSADARSTLMGLQKSDRFRFAAGVLWPSRAHLRARSLSRRGHLAQLGSRIIGR